MMGSSTMVERVNFNMTGLILGKTKWIFACNLILMGITLQQTAREWHSDVSCTPIFILSQTFDLAMTLDQQYNFNLTFD